MFYMRFFKFLKLFLLSTKISPIFEWVDSQLSIIYLFYRLLLHFLFFCIEMLTLNHYNFNFNGFSYPVLYNVNVTGNARWDNL